MKNDAVVLLSGGLDSTVNLYMAHQKWGVSCALTINYGQRAFAKELVAARRSCQALGIEQKVLNLQSLFAETTSSLINREEQVPMGSSVDITSLQQSLETAKSVWVPNRNGVFLSLAAALAESLDCQYVVPGFNKEEAATFPDNSSDYVAAINSSLQYSTQNSVEVISLTQAMDKGQLYSQAQELNIPAENIWSCYLDGEKPCGRCESCLRTERAVKAFHA